jgi:hypothetical protein
MTCVLPLLPRARALPSAVARRAVLAAGVLVVLAGAGVFTPSAYAGQWMQVSCQNPDGSASTNQGWSTFDTSIPNYSQLTDTCPMQALIAGSPVYTGTTMGLQYTPPAGSSLAGGAVDAFLDGSSDSLDAGANGLAQIATPTSGSVVTECSSGTAECGEPSYSFSGVIGLPSNQGGNLYLIAACTGTTGYTCDENGGAGGWASVDLYWADLLLDNSSVPAASTPFSGSVLQTPAHGTADVSFTATDPGGPGVYKVIVAIDGTAVYDATPNTNGGDCHAVGTDPGSGALMFDYAQPCLQAESVDVPINTTAFTDGTHQLKVVVEDAAGNEATVLNQQVTIANATSPSALLSGSWPASPGTNPGTPPGGSAPVYTFGLDSATSALGKSVSRAYKKSAVALSGVLDTQAGVLAPGVAVSLWASPANGGAYAQVASTTTDGAGRWSLTAPKGSSRTLSVVAGSGASPTSSASVVSLNETVSPTLSLKVASLPNARLSFSGKLGISPLGSPRPIVVMQSRVDGHWQNFGSSLRVSATGAYHLVWAASPMLAGRSFAFRATTAATSLWLAGSSPAHSAVVQ